jgi:signal recognition particle subunit SRP54
MNKLTAKLAKIKLIPNRGLIFEVSQGCFNTVQSSHKADRDILKKKGIIHSMMLQERRKSEIIKATRKRRIAAGAGVQVQEVNRMLNEFEQMQTMMKKMKGGGMMKMMQKMGGIEKSGGMSGMKFPRMR